MFEVILDLLKVALLALPFCLLGMANGDETEEEKAAREETEDAARREANPKDEDESEEDYTTRIAGIKEEEETKAEEARRLEKEEITLTDGTKVTRKELVDGYLRQEDYTAKTQELAAARRQLTMARETIEAQPAGPGKETALDRLKKLSKETEEAFAELDENDVGTKVFQAINKKLDGIIGYIGESEERSEKDRENARADEETKFFRKLTNDTLDEVSKEFHLPKAKTGEGKEVNYKTLWLQLVNSSLMSIDRNLTVEEYRELVRETGRKTYEYVRSIISASGTRKPKPKSPESPAGGPGAEPKKGEDTGLAGKLTRGFNKIMKAKGEA